MRRLIIPASAQERAATVDADALFSALAITVTPSMPYTVPGPGRDTLRYHHPFAILNIPQSVITRCRSIMAPHDLCTNALLLIVGSVLCGEDGCGFGPGARLRDGQTLGTVLAQCARWNLPQFRDPLPAERGALDLLFSMRYLGTRQGGVDVTVNPYPGVPMAVWRIFLSTLSSQARCEAPMRPLVSGEFITQ
ncbi:MAG: hypothetical protein C0462_12610 [Alcanivorax sp.]|nr:hypothetical protein [Alcanivorax sp.]